MGQVRKETLAHLTKAQMQRMPKPRAGFEAYAAQLVALAQSHPALQSKDFDAAAILEDLRAYQALQPVCAEADQQAALAHETRFLHGSNAWGAILNIYHHAQAEVRGDQTVEYGIAGFEEFLKNGPRKKDETAVTPPAATTTP